MEKLLERCTGRDPPHINIMNKETTTKSEICLMDGVHLKQYLAQFMDIISQNMRLFFHFLKEILRRN